MVTAARRAKMARAVKGAKGRGFSCVDCDTISFLLTRSAIVAYGSSGLVLYEPHRRLASQNRIPAPSNTPIPLALSSNDSWQHATPVDALTDAWQQRMMWGTTRPHIYAGVRSRTGPSFIFADVLWSVTQPRDPDQKKTRRSANQYCWKRVQC